MPFFYTRDGRHFASYTTGPAHVLLGIRFCDVPAEPALVMLPPVGTCTHAPLDEAQIRDAVLQTLGAVRAEAGVSLYAAEVVYVQDDTPVYGLYRHAAGQLARRFLEGGEFQV